MATNIFRAIQEGRVAALAATVLAKTYKVVVGASGNQLMQGYLKRGLCDKLDENSLAVLFISDSVKEYLDPNNPKDKEEVRRYLRIATAVESRGLVESKWTLDNLRDAARTMFNLGPDGQDLATSTRLPQSSQHNPEPMQRVDPVPTGLTASRAAPEPIKTTIVSTDADDWAYEKVALELEQNDLDKAQWTRAFSETGGDENKVKAIYIQRRVQRLVATEAVRISELNAQSQRDMEVERERQQQEKQAAQPLPLQKLEAVRLEQERVRQEKYIAEQLRVRELEIEMRNQEKIEKARLKYPEPILQASTGHSTQVASAKANKSTSKLPIFLGLIVAVFAIFTTAFNKAPSTPRESLANGQQVATTSDAYARGYAAYNRGDYEEAIREWKPLALQGNAAAQSNLGYLYANGRGVAQDYKQAGEWYLKAATQGSAVAQEGLGRLYANGFGVAQDYKQAFSWWAKAAVQGNADAQTGLGWLYASGQGIAQDYKLAIDWYSKAATKGDADAQTRLGYLYARGDGVPVDHRQAFKWLLKAAVQGRVDAQASVGAMYALGRGVAQDNKQAFDWYSKAAILGDADAQNALGWGYEHGVLGAAQDDKLAFDWYSKAASQGNALAQANLSSLYALGLGVGKNYTLALELFGKATTQDLNHVADGYRSDAEKKGGAFNLAALGWLYDIGSAFGKDVVLAHMFFTLARNAGLMEIEADQNRLAALMTPKQLAESMLLAAGWKVGSSFPIESKTGKQ